MGSDCTVKIDDGLINIRVGAIIMKDNKFLMVGNDRQEYLYSVGGRIKFGETAEEAVRREVFEETGVRMEVDRLGFIHENYFYGDYEMKQDKLIYEVSYFFYMKVPDDFQPKCESFTDDKFKEKLIWVTAESKMVYYPEFFRTELKNPQNFVKHIVTDGRKKPAGADRVVDSEVTLVPYYPHYDVTFEWYQDLDVCKQVDNIDHAYSMDTLVAMYTYLSTHGKCYYIKYKGKLVGDVTLLDNAEVCIVICRGYQNMHIGRRCILEMIKLAKEKGLSRVRANIYSFNVQSRKMFTSIGFKQVDEEWFELEL